MHAGCPLPNSPTQAGGLSVACGSFVRGFVVLGVSGKWVRSSVCQTTSVRPSPTGSNFRQWIVTLFICVQWKNIIRIDLVYDQPFPNDRRRGAVTDSDYPLESGVFFMTLKFDQYEKKWQYDSDGNRVCTMLRKRNRSWTASAGAGCIFSGGDTTNWTGGGGKGAQ